jgi:protein-S-isoprenylcysteine O-methyltransferase Ste14
MDIERETVMEIGAAILPVIVFIVLLVYFGSSYSSNGDLTQAGGLVVVGLLVLFIVGMVGIGYWLAVMGDDEE